MFQKQNRKQRRALKSIERREAFDELLRLIDDAWYSVKQVAQLYGGVHKITVWRWAKDGIIPPPTKLGPNTSRWHGKAIREDQERKRAASAA